MMLREPSSSAERLSAWRVGRQTRPEAGLRVLWALGLCAVALLLAGFAVRVVKHVALQQTMDDAYMFVRYADHVLSGHGITWNVPGEPTYGLTSLAYLLVVTPIRLLLPDAPCEAAVLSSLLSGVAFVALAGVLVYRHGRGVGEDRAGVTQVVRFVLCAVAVLVLFQARWHLGFHMTTGMDTMFDLSALTALLLGHCALATGPTRGRAAAMGVASGLLFLVRPDLLVFAFGIPLTVLVLGPAAESRRAALVTVATAALTLGLVLVATRLYFGVPLPLSFYAKQTGLYTGAIEDVYAGSAERNAHIFFSYYKHAMLFIALSVLVFIGLRLREKKPLRPTSWGPRADHFGSLDVGILAAGLVFLAYYTFVARMQIMGNKARFFMPAVPAVIYLTVRCLVVVWPLERVLRMAKVRVGTTAVALAARFQHLLWAGMVLTAALVSFGLERNLEGFIEAKARTPRGVKWFDMDARLQRSLFYWYRLDEVTKLPNDMIIATSEVGLPSALNPGRRIIDLVGLNSTQLVRDRLDPDKLLARVPIDLIYMPHPHYSDYLTSIRNSQRFQADYEWYSKDQLGTDFGVAIRKGSKYYQRLRAIIDQGPAQRPAG